LQVALLQPQVDERKEPGDVPILPESQAQGSRANA